MPYQNIHFAQVNLVKFYWNFLFKGIKFDGLKQAKTYWVSIITKLTVL